MQAEKLTGRGLRRQPSECYTGAADAWRHFHESPASHVTYRLVIVWATLLPFLFPVEIRTKPASPRACLNGMLQSSKIVVIRRREANASVTPKQCKRHLGDNSITI